MEKVPQTCLSSATTRMRKGNGDKLRDRDMCDDPRKDQDEFNNTVLCSAPVYLCTPAFTLGLEKAR